MFEFGIPDFDDSFLTTPGHDFRIGRTPLLIEVFNEISGINFKSCFDKKEYVEVDGEFKIPIISLDDLITNKSSTDRIKDKADLEYLLQIKSK